MLKVLAFGHLPKEAGGRQSSGASYGALNMARALARARSSIEYVLSCTDVNSSIKHVVELRLGGRVIGWTKIELVVFLFAHPFLSLRLFGGALSHRYRYRDERGIIRTFGTLLFYAAAIQYQSPELLHVHGVDRAVLLNYIPNARELPRVTTLHGVIGFDENLPARSHALERDALRTNSYFVSVSNRTQSTILSQYESVPDRYAVIPNGVDLQKFVLLDQNQCRRELNLPLSKTIILTVASFGERKGQALILHGIASLSHNVQERICCVFVGNGVGSLKSEARRSDFEVHLYEHVEQHKLTQFYNAADYHLSASSSEGFGAIMVESIACGTPIIIPKTCDLVEEEFIIDGVNSIVFQEPTVSGIRDVIERALSARFDRETVRDTGMHMSWNQVAARYAKLFRSLAQDKKTEDK